MEDCFLLSSICVHCAPQDAKRSIQTDYLVAPQRARPARSYDALDIVWQR